MNTDNTQPELKPLQAFLPSSFCGSTFRRSGDMRSVIFHNNNIGMKPAIEASIQLIFGAHDMEEKTIAETIIL